jgi:two-component system phosphate regulon response regulator PhoB
MQLYNILILEADSTIFEMIRWNFRREGFNVEQAKSGEDALQKLTTGKYQLAVLNWDSRRDNRRDDVVEICRRFRATETVFSTAIIVTAAGRTETDIINAYQAGIDDFIAKPFSNRELLARIRAILRRTNRTSEAKTLKVSGLEMDVDRYEIKYRGQDLRLSIIEFHILRYMMENPGTILSREQIRSSAWGKTSDVNVRTIDVRVARLRKIINANKRPDIIRTIRSQGYMLG